MSIRVNDIEIDEQAIHLEMQHHPAPSVEQARGQAARALVVRELLLQEARRRNVQEGASEEQRIAALLEAELDLPEVTEDACRRYFQNNPARFRTEDLHLVSHILIVPDPEQPALRAKAQAKAKAEALIRVLADDPARFAELAGRHSACPSRETGGNLGQIGKGQTVAEFEQALSRMRDGEISAEPVESRYGYHIIRLERRIPGRQLDYELVRERIAGYLTDSVRRRAVSQYLSLLAGRAEVHGIELNAAASPLVQ